MYCLEILFSVMSSLLAQYSYILICNTKQYVYKEKKEGDQTQSYDKTPKTADNSKTKGQHTKATKTSITQRLRTDIGRSVGVTSHPTGVVKPVYGYPTFPLTAKAV